MTDTRYHIPGADPAYVQLGIPFDAKVDGHWRRHPAMWLASATQEQLDELGAVLRPAAVGGKVVVETEAGWAVRDMTPAELAAAVATAKAEALAELARRVQAAVESFVPPHMALAYGEKYRQALKVLDGGEPGAALVKEAAQRGISVNELALLVKMRAERWDIALGDIEAARRDAEQAIEAAATAAGAAPATVRAPVASLVLPLRDDGISPA